MGSRSDWIIKLVSFWLGLDFAYTAYAALNYNGLFQWLAETELRVFHGYDPVGTFIVLLAGLSLPIWVFTPKEVLTRPLFQPSVGQHMVQRSTRKTCLLIAAVGLVIGMSTAGLALWHSARSCTVAVLNFNRESDPRFDADRVIVSGRLQLSNTVDIEMTLNGSTRKTSYIPVTAANWTSADGFRYVLRQSQGSPTRGTDASERYPSDRTRIGPLAVLHQALPGIVRTEFERRELHLLSPVVILDEDLTSSYQLLWVISFLSVIGALIFAAIGVSSAKIKSHKL